MPRKRFWTLPHVPESIPTGSQLQAMVARPDMQDLLQDNPNLIRMLRPLCRTLGVDLPPTLPQPPRKRRQPAPARPPRPATAAATPAKVEHPEPAATAPPPPPSRRWPGMRRDGSYPPGRDPTDWGITPDPVEDRMYWLPRGAKPPPDG